VFEELKKWSKHLMMMIAAAAVTAAASLPVALNCN